jgi:hypothetical protein
LLLALVLVAALAFQLAISDEPDLPGSGPLAGSVGATAGALAMPLPSRAGPIALRPIFAPRIESAATGAGPASLTVLVGSVRIGRAAFAIVQPPGGGTARIGIGGRIGGWRLQSLEDARALLVRGGERVTVPFGGQIPSAAQTPQEGKKQ